MNDHDKVIFSRNLSGRVQLAPESVARAARHVRENSGLLSRVHHAVRNAAAKELISQARQLMVKEALGFDAAIKVANPDLLLLSCCEVARSSADADVALREEGDRDE